MSAPCICTECGQPCDYDHSCEKLREIEAAVKLFAPGGDFRFKWHTTADWRTVGVESQSDGRLVRLTGDFTAAELKAIARVMETNQ